MSSPEILTCVVISVVLIVSLVVIAAYSISQSTRGLSPIRAKGFADDRRNSP